MTRFEKEYLTEEINAFVAKKYGVGSFSFAKTGEARTGGEYFLKTNRIVVKSRESFWVVAHEIAHLEQHIELGETSCRKYPLRGDHTKRERRILEELKQLGVDKMWYAMTA